MFHRCGKLPESVDHVQMLIACTARTNEWQSWAASLLADMRIGGDVTFLRTWNPFLGVSIVMGIPQKIDASQGKIRLKFGRFEGTTPF